MPTTQEIETAQAAVMKNIYAPALFNKLAQHGVVPQNEAEAVSLVKLASTLRSQIATKTASAPGNRFETAGQRLNATLGLSKQSQADGYREAAVQIAADPELFKQAQLLHAQLN
jgi:hypothetical protein